MSQSTSSLFFQLPILATILFVSLYPTPFQAK